MKRFSILALLLLLGAHPAQAQTSCSVLSQSQLLNSFSDTAPAGSISPRNMRDFVCSSALLSASGTLTSGDGAMFLNSGSGVVLQDASTGTPLFPLGISSPANANALISNGSSLYPTAVPSIQATCSIVNGSVNATCPPGLAINVGDTVFASPSSDVSSDGGVWPTVVSYDPVAGATVFTSAATVTNASESIRFGSGQRFDINSTIMANSIFGKAGKFGNAAQGRTWWADNNPGYTSNLTNTGPSLTVGSNGNIISGLIATHAIGAGSSHQIALDILARADATTLVSGNTNSIWGLYLQVDTVASAAAFSNAAGNEIEITNRWGVVDLDPYSGATTNTTNLMGFGCGSGETSNVAWGTISPCTSAISIFGNGSSFRQGIYFTTSALDTSSGRIAPALSMAKNQAINFYGATGHPQWSIYSNSNATNQDSIILGNGNNMTIQGDATAGMTLTVQSQGAFQSRLWIDDAGTAQNTEADFLEAGTLKWRIGKRGSDSAFNLIDVANASAVAILISNTGAATFGEAATTTKVQGSTILFTPTTTFQITGLATSGTATGSLCITAGGVVFQKTTTGPCL